jgi:hypothetical protein
MMCGERRASERRYTLLAFIQELVIELANVDGRTLRTVKTLLTSPGKLTAEFMRGARIPYLAPVQFFLIMNLTFFVWAAAAGAHFFDTPLYLHLNAEQYSRAATRMVRERLTRDPEPEQAYRKRFDAVGTAQARSLVGAMIPAFALLVGIAAFRLKNRPPVVKHVVFALHSYCFLFVLICVSRYLIDVPVGFILHHAGVPPGELEYDAQKSIVALVVFMTYVGLSLRRAYDLSKRRAVAGGFFLGVGFFAILTAYRGLLFWVTFHSV